MELSKQESKNQVPGIFGAVQPINIMESFFINTVSDGVSRVENFDAMSVFAMKNH
jgi:hypothetical protein